MYVNREDKNIFLMILGILVVSLVALIAIFNIVFQIIKPPLEKVAANISKVIKVNNLDYNFQVPPKRDTGNILSIQPTPQPQPQPEPEPISGPVIDYNFQIPQNKTLDIVKANTRFYESITNDLLYKFYSEDNKSFDSSDYSVVIPKIDLNSRIFEGSDSRNLLQRGFWVNPVSRKFGQGGVVLMCYRRYFDSNDPRSCYYLNNLTIGDEIYIQKGDTKIKYKVKGINEFGEPVDFIYQGLTNDDYIKIVTSSPTDLGTKRLVVMAYRNTSN